MRKWQLIIMVPIAAVLLPGCVTVVALNHGYHGTPAYCYDCHINPLWTAACNQCDYYIIKASAASYFYRPRNNKQARIVHRYYDQKVVRKRQTRHQKFVKAHADVNKQVKDFDRDGGRKKSLSFK